MADGAMATGDLLGALERHYRKPGADRDGEVLLREVAAPRSQRRADLVRVGLWASRGAGIDVHEVKVSRSDWLRELEDKGKAEAWWPYCSRFWVVAPSTDVVPAEEVPPGWGLMVPPTSARGRRFKVIVKPRTKSPRLTVQLLVELVRRTDNVRLGEIDQLRVDMHEQIRREVDRRVAEMAQRGLDHETRSRVEDLDRLEELLGVTLGGWRAWGAVTDDRPGVQVEELAAAMQAYVRGHINIRRVGEQAATRLDRARQSLTGAVAQLDVALGDVREVGSE